MLAVAGLSLLTLKRILLTLINEVKNATVHKADVAREP
ncbi:unnamed protein product [[Actinomadura] parvosata subsp. kistnae]|nr:unnamed protein product [Actinomadura parvosata subsp. kistnae]